jgi:integrase
VAHIELTQSFVETSACPTGRRKADYTDRCAKGLMLEVRATGGKTYYVRYTNERGKQRMYRLGDAAFLTLAQARKKCHAAQSRLQTGQDPCEEKKAARSVPTFGVFVEQQYLPYIRSYKRSWADDVGLLRNHLLPRFGKLHLDEITRQDIQKMHHDRRAAGAAPGSANRLLILIRYIFNLALRWEVPGLKSNPCKGVPLMAENNKKERYLSAEEAKRLYESVCRSENPMLRHVVAMLILSGARKREVLDARWEDFDIPRRLWRIPISKSGRARHVPLADGALAILASLPRREGVAWPFANPDTGKPFVSFYCAWDSARKRAGLGDVRLHDLRHSFASLLVNSGRTLYEVQHILGHTQVKTTQRYAHLSQDTLLAAANAATVAVGSVMGVMPHRVDVPMLAMG